VGVFHTFLKKLTKSVTLTSSRGEGNGRETLLLGCVPKRSKKAMVRTIIGYFNQQKRLVRKNI
jgi:hypothetical protein